MGLSLKKIRNAGAGLLAIASVGAAALPANAQVDVENENGVVDLSSEKEETTINTAFAPSMAAALEQANKCNATDFTSISFGAFVVSAGLSFGESEVAGVSTANGLTPKALATMQGEERKDAIDATELDPDGKKVLECLADEWARQLSTQQSNERIQVIATTGDIVVAGIQAQTAKDVEVIKNHGTLIDKECRHGFALATNEKVAMSIPGDKEHDGCRALREESQKNVKNIMESDPIADAAGNILKVGGALSQIGKPPAPTLSR